jgi:hypothetical protein
MEKELCRVIYCPFVATTAIGPIEFHEQVGPPGGHLESFAVCDAHAAEHSREAGALDPARLSADRRREATHWARRCDECGTLNQQRYATREHAQLKSYGGYGERLGCRRCGSLEFTAVELALER